MRAHRLARGWSRPQAVERILAAYEADGLRPPRLTCQRLCAWEHDPKVRPGEDYLDRLCRVYETRADLLGYGCDYTLAAEPAMGDGPAAYAGVGGADCETRPDGEEAGTSRDELLRAAGATGLAALLDQAGQAAARVSAKLGS